MNKLFKRAACLAVTAAMTLSSSGALACTGYYVGKQASASGHTTRACIEPLQPNSGPASSAWWATMAVT